MSASMRLRHLDHLQPLSRTKHSLIAMAQNDVCPRDEIADAPGMNVFLIDRHGFADCFVSFRTLCSVQSAADFFCSESSARVRSALRAGKGRNPVFLVCVGLN